MINFDKLLHSEDVKEEKFRNELKYVVSESELQIIKMRIENIMQQDSHAGENGIYTIRSVYFDDINDSCYYENENGTDKREKFRIRAYNADSSFISLECKKKERAMTNKKSCKISLEQYNSIIKGEFKLHMADNPLLRRFAMEMERRQLAPKVIVVYDRTPFVYKLGNVRVTFDRNISSSTNIDCFFDEKLPLRPIMEKGKHVLEVKYDEFIPTYIYTALNLSNLRQTAFSKYYLCRKFTM